MLMLKRFSCFLFVVLWTLSSLPLSASEPAEAFLEAFRERRMHDMALDYLDRAEKNPLVDQEIRERLDLERGLTLIQGAAYQGDFASDFWACCQALRAKLERQREDQSSN